MDKIELSPKQAEYIVNATHRFNFKIGATQCGKTHLDVLYMIPSRIYERKGLKGLNLILGVTKETIERNVLEPMRDIWGDKLVSPINSRNVAIIFGQKVYCLGSEKVNQVSKMRGAKFKYVYIDEAVDMNEEVFTMLKSRMSLEYSCCDATGNPSFPRHFIKQFIDSDADVYCQNWTLYDNPFIPSSYIKNLEIEYEGTVYYNRYILGEWTQAEGLVYPHFNEIFSDNVPVPSDGFYSRYVLSCDYGTQNAFACLLWGEKDHVWYIVREYRYSGRDTGLPKTDDEYLEDITEFVSDIKFDPDNKIPIIIDPSASSFITLCKKKSRFRVRTADNSVDDGIRETATCIKRGIIKASNSCKELRKEFEGYVYDDKLDDKPVKENDHLMDAMRYFVKTMNISRVKTHYKPIYN